MSSDLQIQGEVVVSADKAEAAFDRVGDKATQMATEVASAAGKAGQAVDGIGSGAEKGAERFTRAEARMRDAIKKSTQELQLLGKTASEKLEFNIQAKGLDAGKFASYIAELKQAEAAQRIATGSLDTMGLSAKQTAAALRGVPAQFTDIIVSLQSGQAPLTVLLQQGGQLKDMFGGTGNAVRALGSYVAGLVSPLTLTAAAVAALGVAMFSINGKDAALRELSTQLTGTGRASVAAVGDIKGLVAELNLVPGVSKASATAIITEFAKVAGVGSSLFKGLGSSVADFAAATGADLPSAAKKLADAFADPAKGARTLEDALGTLTAAQILNIENLAAMGDQSGAQVALMEALKQATQGLAEQAMTPLGQATDKLSNSWDALTTSIGNSTAFRTANTWLATLIESVADLTTRLAGMEPPTWLKYLPGVGPAIGAVSFAGGAMKAPAANGATGSWNVGGATGSWAPTESEADRQVKAALDATRSYESQTAAVVRLQGVVKQAKNALQELESQNKGTGVEAATLRDRIAGLNEKLEEMAKKGKTSGSAGVGENAVAAVLARNEERADYLKRLRAQIAGDTPLTDNVKPTQNEELAAKVQKELETSIKGVARAQKEKELAAAQAGIQTDKDIQAAERQKKGLIDLLAIQERQTDAVQKQADSIRDQAISQESVNANLGKSKTAVEQATLAQIKLQQAEAESSDRFAPAYVAALASKTAAQERFVQALQQSEYLQSATKLDEAGRVAAEETASVELQLSLIGRSQFEREKIIAQRQIEVRLAKELAEIEKLNLGEGPEAEAKRAELRAKAAANAVVEGNNAASKVVLDEWQRTADSINSSLTDALLRGFESGKSFAANLRDTLVNMFKTLVLRPIISFIINPIAGAISSVITGALGMAGTASAGASVLGAAGNVASGASMFGNAASLLGGAGTAAGYGASALFAGNGMGALAGGWGMLTGGGPAAIMAQGAGMIAGVLGPIALGIAALTAIIGKTKGETRIGGQFGVAYGGEVDNNRRGQTYTYEGQQYDRDFSGGARNPLVDGQAYRLEGDPVRDESLIRQAVSGTAMGITEMLKALGSSLTVTGFTAGLETSGKGRGGVFAGGTLSDGTTFGESGTGDNYAGTLYEITSTNSPDYETALKNFTLDLKQSTIQALQAAGDIPESVKKMIEDVDAEALTDEAANALLTSINAQITGVTNFRSALDQMGLTDFADMAYDTAVAIAEASGGFEQLQSNLTSFYQNYYTEEERRANTQATIEEKLKELGLTMPKTREEFRALVEELMAMGEAGAAALAVVLGLAGAFASITDTAQSAADALGITADGLASIMSDAVLNSSSRGEAEQKASQGFETMFYEGILNTMTSALSEGLMSAVLGPLLNGLVGGAIASGTALAVGGAAGGGAVAAGGAMGGGAVAAGGSAAGGAVAAGGMQAGAAMAAGGEAAGGRVTDFITSAREYINQFVAVLRDPGVQGAIGEFAGIFGNITGDLYEGMNTFFINSKAMPAVGGSLSGAMGGVKDSMQDLTDSLVEEVKRIRGLVEDGAEANLSLAALKSQFAIATAQARAGDKEAAAKLPELSQRMLELAEKNASSSAELRLIQATTAASLQATAEALVKKYGGKLPSFAVGTNEIPFDMVAQVHQGERIIPAADNRALIGAIQRNGTGDDSQAAMQGMDARFQKMQDHLAEIERNTKRVDDVINNWSRNGAPVVNQEGTTLETTP